MTTAVKKKVDTIEGVLAGMGKISFPLETYGEVVEGTGGLLAVRPLGLTWDAGEPKLEPGGLPVWLNTESLAGEPLGNDRDGLPEAEALSAFADLEEYGPDRLRSVCWALVGLATGRIAVIMHRRSDAEYIGRQVYGVAPDAWKAADLVAWTEATPPGVGGWVGAAEKLLNRGLPRAMLVTCKEYLERREAGHDTDADADADPFVPPEFNCDPA
jgi:hypothetical protein